MTHVKVLALALVAAAGACRPVGLAGDDCTSGPCAAGLQCVAGVCKEVTPPPPPPPPCTQDSDCVLNGNADGRVCNSDGTCGFSSCIIDQQCGTRICDQGSCADNHPCANDGDCGAGTVCTNNSCRAACQSDADCPSLGGFALAQCVDGRCDQRCLNDAMCLGGICEANLCAPAQCQQDADCTDPGNFFCNGGRCEAFTPCTTNADCFDPNFQCNAQGRCEERPACTVDAECGGGLCLARHCQDAVACTSSADCSDASTECVAGRCVAALACRSSADCDAGEVCDAGRCADPPAPATAAVTVVKTPLGACFAGGLGACKVPAFVGDSVAFYAQGYADDGSPLSSAVALTSASTASVDDDGVASVTCDAAGAEPATLDAGVEGVDVTVRCVDPGAAALALLAYDPATGSAVAGAHVFLDDAEAGLTDADGAFTAASFAGGTVAVQTDDGRGFALVDAQPGHVWIPLADPSSSSSSSAAGFRAQVTGSADSTPGPVGLGLALPATASPRDATLENVVGAPFSGTLTLQVLGGIPVSLPASATMDASLPLSGPQVIKQDAFDVAPAGPQSALCYEQRFQQSFLLQVAFAADPTSTALDFVAQAEGMDAKLVAAGVLAEAPLVSDADDVDGDGNTTELVPDFQNFSELSAVPTTTPNERVGVVTSAPPQGMNARAFAVCGVELPTGFLPLGVAAFSGSDAGEQVKIVSPPSSVAGAGRACAVHGVSADPATQSFVVVRAPAFAASLDAGPLLDPPAGAFVLADVPQAGDHSVVIPAVAGADALAVTVFDGATTWQVVAPNGGSIALPPFVDPIVLVGTTAYRLGGSPSAALGDGAVPSLDDVARAVSTSP